VKAAFLLLVGVVEFYGCLAEMQNTPFSEQL
jgi:hypothetical protein